MPQGPHRQAAVTRRSAIEFDLESFAALASMCGIAGVAFLALILPIVGPPTMSRKGNFSIGRWLIFAGLSLLLFTMATGIAWVESRDAWG